MRVSVVQIGNSKGIRIPKAILEQCNIESEVTLEVENGKIVLESIPQTPRQGWMEAFQDMKTRNDDALLIDDMIDVNMDDWQW